MPCISLINVDILADTEQHKCREEFHRHLPSAHRFDADGDGGDGQDGGDEDGDDDNGADENDDDEHCQLVWNFTNFHFRSSINFDLFPHHM